MPSTKTIGKLLCKCGMHKWKYVEIWKPSIDAEIVTGYTTFNKCERCGKEKDRIDSWFFDALGMKTPKE